MAKRTRWVHAAFMAGLGMATLIGAACEGAQRVAVDAGPENIVDAGQVGPVDAGQDAPTDLRDRLLAIDGIDVEELPGAGDGTRMFALKIKQPEDHAAPDGRWFKQRVVLTHRSEDRPMVLMNTGYGLFVDPAGWTGHYGELTQLVGGNQLIVEHRFFESSIVQTPNEPDWSKLTIAQSAQDTHAIVEKLKAIYPEAWLGTGASKGGMTAIFHHRFYPDDFAGIVPYVAPISFGLEDDRYSAFLDQNGPEACRETLRDTALAFVTRRAEIATALQDDPQYQFFKPEVLALFVAFTARNAEWAFWQYHGATLCANLPGGDAPAEALAAVLPSLGFNPVSFLGGGEASPYGYQVANELGGPDYGGHYLNMALSEVDWSAFPMTGSLPPWGANPTFDAFAMQDVDDWLKFEARNVLAIYGEFDPWTGGKAALGDDPSNALLVAPAANHSAQIAMLSAADATTALAWLERVADVPVQTEFSHIDRAAQLKAAHAHWMHLQNAAEQAR